jgi:hypothetical protein
MLCRGTVAGIGDLGGWAGINDAGYMISIRGGDALIAEQTSRSMSTSKKRG